MKLFVPRISITNIPVVRAIVVAIYSLAAVTNSAHGQLYGIEYNTGNLDQISTANAALSLVGNTGASLLGSMEYRPANGFLYGISSDPLNTGNGNGLLYRINPASASTTLVGSIGPEHVFEGGLVIAPDGTAYATNMNFNANPTLFKINLDTAATTTVGVISGGDHDINGLAWRSDNMLVVLDRVTNSLLAINPSTAVSSVIAAVSAPIGGAGGMAPIDDSGYFATGNFNGSNSLYSFNLNSGAHTLIGSFAPTIAGVGISGLALVVPEPTGMTLAALAIVPLLVRRRRSQVKTPNFFGCRDRNVTSAVSAMGDVVRFQLSALIVAAVQVNSFGVEQAAANSIPVGNAGFENPPLGDGGFTGSIPSWVVGDGVSDAGVFNPNAEYPGGIPEGQNVAFSKDPIISQVLGVTLQANSLYTLQVDIGHRNNEPTLPGYAVELYAGGTLLASESSLAPGPGTFLTSVVSYFASPSDPLVGQALEIRLQVTPLLPYQVNFDNVRLDATVPGLTGDYDHNGIVDAADYVVWRKDSNRTTAQYDEWRSHFGQPPGSGAALPSAEPLSAAVPEPPTMVILLLGVVVMWCGRRSQNHKLISG